MRVHYIAVIMLLALTGHASPQITGTIRGPAGSGLGEGGAPARSSRHHRDLGLARCWTSKLRRRRSARSRRIKVLATTGEDRAAGCGCAERLELGQIGIGATPSGLPGDDPLNPGFPKAPGSMGQ